MKIVPLIVGALLLSGCASGVSSAQRATMQAEINKTIPTCAEARDCELKWAAARRWVLSNSPMKIQQMTPDFIETYNPLNSSPDIAVRVVKEPVGSAGYRILARVWCDNMFGCQPDAQAAIIDFNRVVNEASLK